MACRDASARPQPKWNESCLLSPTFPAGRNTVQRVGKVPRISVDEPRAYHDLGLGGDDVPTEWAEIDRLAAEHPDRRVEPQNFVDKRDGVAESARIKLPYRKSAQGLVNFPFDLVGDRGVPRKQ